MTIIQDDENEYNIGSPYPYYAVKLTSDEAKRIHHREMIIYDIEGKTLFEIKDENGKPTGEMMFFVIFK